MGNVVFWMSVSVDGFFAGPNGELDWNSIDEEFHQYMNDTLAPAAAFLEGRVVWELMADYWPTADEDPDASDVVKEFARIWRDKPKLLYSRTRTEAAGWNTTIVRDVIPAEVEALKAQYDGNLIVGGAILANEFRRLGLVDEYWLFVHPVVLGHGRALFEDREQMDALRLIETKPFSNGVVELHYAVDRA